MIRERLHALLPAVILVLFPMIAHGAGTITQLTASPNPAVMNQDVVFTVGGTGGCNEVILDYGDGQTFTMTSVSFSQKPNQGQPVACAIRRFTRLERMAA